jgi:hypothetical protein
LDEKGFPFFIENEFPLAKAGFICYKKRIDKVANCGEKCQIGGKVVQKDVHG